MIDEFISQAFIWKLARRFQAKVMDQSVIFFHPNLCPLPFISFNVLLT